MKRLVIISLVLMSGCSTLSSVQQVAMECNGLQLKAQTLSERSEEIEQLKATTLSMASIAHAMQDPVFSSCVQLGMEARMHEERLRAQKSQTMVQALGAVYTGLSIQEAGANVANAIESPRHCTSWMWGNTIDTNCW